LLLTTVLFVVAASYALFVGIRGSVTHFFQSLGNATHFQNELKETLYRGWTKCRDLHRCQYSHVSCI